MAKPRVVKSKLRCLSILVWFVGFDDIAVVIAFVKTKKRWYEPEIHILCNSGSSAAVDCRCGFLYARGTGGYKSASGHKSISHEAPSNNRPSKSGRKPRFSPNRRFHNVDYRCNSGCFNVIHVLLCRIRLEYV